MKPKFTIPKLSKTSKYWYIHFRYEGKQFRETMGLNTISNLKKRESEFNEFSKVLLNDLKSGWNPNVPEGFQVTQNMKLNDAITFALNKKLEHLADKTKISYTSAVNFFIAASNKLKLHDIDVNDVRRIHIKSIFEQIQKDRKWSNKAYNKNLGYIKSMFSELLQWDKIENNPAHGIRSLKVEEVLANIVATDKQIETIKKHLLDTFPSFYYYVVTIFHTGLRPNELLQVKVSMIDLDKKEIKIPAKITKTNIDRLVTINPFMEVYLNEILKSNVEPQNYLFGNTRAHTNRGLKRESDFICGPNRLTRDCASKLWRKLIKTELGIDVNMYSLKHLGGDKKLLAGMDLDTLRDMYGHTSKRMTLRYVKGIKEVYRKQIIEKSPDF